MRLNSEFTPHKIRSEYSLALLEPIDEVWIRPELTPTHQFRPLITGDFREVLCATCSPGSRPANKWRIEFVVAFVITIISDDIG
jgi:hypothetical protein